MKSEEDNSQKCQCYLKLVDHPVFQDVLHGVLQGVLHVIKVYYM